MKELKQQCKRLYNQTLLGCYSSYVPAPSNLKQSDRHTATFGKGECIQRTTYNSKRTVQNLSVGKPLSVPTFVSLPLYRSSVSAGFPSPAEEWADFSLDLNTHLIKNTPATFFVRASGDSMQKVGIFNGDLLIVDRSRTPKNQDIVIAAIHGDLTVKRLIIRNGKSVLKAENEGFSPIEIGEDMDVHIWGVVTYVVHDLHT